MTDKPNLLQDGFPAIKKFEDNLGDESIFIQGLRAAARHVRQGHMIPSGRIKLWLKIFAGSDALKQALIDRCELTGADIPMALRGGDDD